MKLEKKTGCCKKKRKCLGMFNLQMLILHTAYVTKYYELTHKKDHSYKVHAVENNIRFDG